MRDWRLRIARWLAVGLVSIGLIMMWVHNITGAPIGNDAAQTVQMALNLDRHGVISLEESPPLTATNYREPGPVFASALAIKLIDIALGEGAPESYFQGERVQLLKYQNVLWLGLLTVGAFFAVRVFTGSFCLALLGALLVNYPFWGSHGAADLVDDLYTDIAADAGLMWASVTLAIALRRRSLWLYGLCGLLFGILTLIKAAILYIFLGVGAMWICVNLLQRAVPARIAALQLAVMVTAFACAVAPWMYRNQVLFGSATISQRAGVVLMYRAVYDQMTPGEYRGTFYAWAPQRLQGLVGRLLGFSQVDLQRNGRLQRLNEGAADFAAEDLAAERMAAPENTFSYYRQARAERVKLEREFHRNAHPQPEIGADDALKGRAIEMILEHPWQHLATTIPFLWRGAIVTFPVLLGTLLIALRKRQYDLFLFAVPAFGLVMLYALFSHFIARYDLPALSVATVILVMSIKPAIQVLSTAYRGRNG